MPSVLISEEVEFDTFNFVAGDKSNVSKLTLMLVWTHVRSTLLEVLSTLSTVDEVEFDSADSVCTGFESDPDVVSSLMLFVLC